MKQKVAFCPTNNWSCPHKKASGICSFDDPWPNCDDFKSFWKEDDNYFSYAEEENHQT